MVVVASRGSVGLTASGDAVAEGQSRGDVEPVAGAVGSRLESVGELLDVPGSASGNEIPLSSNPIVTSRGPVPRDDRRVDAVDDRVSCLKPIHDVTTDGSGIE